MVDSPGSRTPLPPAELVGNRIREKRLFEARFLFNKFANEIDATLRGHLEQELKKRVGLAEQAFKRAELLEQAGDYRKAADVYAEVAATAIDYPQLFQAQQRVELTLQLEPLLTVDPQEADQPLQAVSSQEELVEPPEEPARPIRSPTFAFPSAASVLFPLWQRHKNYFLVLAVLLVFGLGLILFFFRSNDEPAVLINGTPVQDAVQAGVAEQIVPDKNTIDLPPEIFSGADSVEAGLSQFGGVHKDDAGREKTSAGFEERVVLPSEDILTKQHPRIEDLSALLSAPFTDPEVVEPDKPSVKPVKPVKFFKPVKSVSAGAGKKVHVRPLELLESKGALRESSHSLGSSSGTVDIDSIPYGESWRWRELYKLKHQQTLSPDTRNVQQKTEDVLTDDAGQHDK